MPLWMPTCMRSVTWPAEVRSVSDLAERAAHVERRVGRARQRGLAREEEEERVAAELQQPAASRVRDVEQARERRVHDVGHLFGAALSPSRTAVPTSP